jgi:ABC-type sugar transport system substrate-binding protein
MRLHTPLTLAALMATGAAFAADEPVIGLITKTETNPFFVKMKEGAQQAAKAKGAKLLTGAGKADGDNAGQVTAMENMIAGGAKTILITPRPSSRPSRRRAPRACSSSRSTAPPTRPMRPTRSSPPTTTRPAC